MVLLSISEVATFTHKSNYRCHVMSQRVGIVPHSLDARKDSNKIVQIKTKTETITMLVLLLLVAGQTLCKRSRAIANINKAIANIKRSRTSMVENMISEQELNQKKKIIIKKATHLWYRLTALVTTGVAGVTLITGGFKLLAISKRVLNFNTNAIKMNWWLQASTTVNADVKI